VDIHDGARSAAFKRIYGVNKNNRLTWERKEERGKERRTRLFGWSNGHPVSIAHQMTNRTSPLFGKTEDFREEVTPIVVTIVDPRLILSSRATSSYALLSVLTHN
jgi:hypothetical protein